MQERPYQKLIVWQKAHRLCRWVYDVTDSYPPKERFRLVDQMCRSAASVPMNLAEGNAKRSRKEKARFFEIALGSLEELHYQFLLSKDLGYASTEQFQHAQNSMNEVSYLLTRLRASFLS